MKRIEKMIRANGAMADSRQLGAWGHAPDTTKGALADTDFRVRPCFSWTSSDIGPKGTL